MGYYTDFEENGAFTFNNPVEESLRRYINEFSQTRHMLYDTKKIKEVCPTWADRCYEGNLGDRGEFFINPNEDYKDAIDDVNHSGFFPALWCDWCISEDGTKLLPTHAEKPYAYVAQLRYLIEKFFKPKGYVLNGSIMYYGEAPRDHGLVQIRNNAVIVTGPNYGEMYWPSTWGAIYERYSLRTDQIFDKPAENFSFYGKVCCLTGDFAFGSKKDVEGFIVERGGRVSSSVTKHTNVVIAGTYGSMAWTHGSYGSKIEKAMGMRLAGQDMKIFTEKDVILKPSD